jgi:hypothetical protein
MGLFAGWRDAWLQQPARSRSRVLVVLTPDIGAQYFSDVAEVVGLPGGPNPAKMAEVMSGWSWQRPSMRERLVKFRTYTWSFPAASLLGQPGRRFDVPMTAWAKSANRAGEQSHDFAT